MCVEMVQFTEREIRCLFIKSSIGYVNTLHLYSGFDVLERLVY
jgi:hypothetical protein